MHIESLKIRNYKALREVELGSIGKFAVFVGSNGVGKTTLFDVFGFLHDALLYDVRDALARRGGFQEVVSRGEHGHISVELKFREDDEGPLVTYLLEVGDDDGDGPVVEREQLKYRRGDRGQPWKFLDFTRGEGIAVVNEEDYGKKGVREQRDKQRLDQPFILAVKGLGQFQKFKVVAALRRLIERWYVSDFHITDARGSPDAGTAPHLSQTGDNLPLVAKFMFERHRKGFDQVLRDMAARVPGVAGVEPIQTEDGRILLRFKDGSFKDPFGARFVSDGTIKMFAYLLLLNDPEPHPLLCVEEPENQLYPQLLAELAEEFRSYSSRGGQVFVSTHSPELLNAITPQELFILRKRDGFTSVTHAIDEPNVRSLFKAGDALGALWRQGLFEAASQ